MLYGHNWHPIELAETCDQGQNSQCFVGLFWVHWVSWRRDTYKLVNGIRDNLGYMNTDLGQNSIDQLAFRKWEIRIMVVGKDVVEEKRHPDLCQGGHASAHDPHLATSSWNSVYSPSLSWTRLSLRKDQPLIASKQRWCSSLQKRCPSNSISACGAALDPSPMASFLALLVRSFFGAIACNDTSIKS